MKKDFVILLDGKNGMFRTENSLTLFQDHVTELRIKEALQSIKKLAKEMTKHGEIHMDIMESVNYSRSSKFRLIFGRNWNGITVDFRKITPQGDFSDSTIYTFTTERSMYAWIMKFVEQEIRNTFTIIPEERCLYLQSLDTND